jgi:mannose-6-phosphate isomerase-like protein (cupin superfamily)
MSYNTVEYLPGQDLAIPTFKIHWLINPNKEPLSFICEYAPHPWDGDNDEPEFPNLSTLLKFVEAKGLMEKLKSN